MVMHLLYQQHNLAPITFGITMQNTLALYSRNIDTPLHTTVTETNCVKSILQDYILFNAMFNAMFIPISHFEVGVLLSTICAVPSLGRTLRSQP